MTVEKSRKIHVSVVNGTSMLPCLRWLKRNVPNHELTPHGCAYWDITYKPVSSFCYKHHFLIKLKAINKSTTTGNFYL